MIIVISSTNRFSFNEIILINEVNYKSIRLIKYEIIHTILVDRVLERLFCW